jgi:mRNA-degrading endonuclease RelE of RelBE toxin-antitoxin system
MRNHVEIDPTAKRDLRRMGPGPERTRVIAALQAALEPVPPPDNADIVPLAGAAPWMRFRVGDWRVIYRPLTHEELARLKDTHGTLDGPEGYLVQRIVHRRDLTRAVASLL